MTRRLDPYQFRVCRCECDCREPITKDEARECKGLCIACYGGFHGLQTALRLSDTGDTPKESK